LCATDPSSALLRYGPPYEPQYEQHRAQIEQILTPIKD